MTNGIDILAKGPGPAVQPRRATLWWGAAGCYLLAYVFILVMAFRKGLDILDAYSLLVWLVSALVLAGFCGLTSLVAVALLGRLAVKRKSFLLLWAGVTVVLGAALAVTAW